MKTSSTLKSWLALGVALLAGAGVQAQGSYPDKPITLIVPFPPGIVDANARVIATKAAALLGQPFVVQVLQQPADVLVYRADAAHIVVHVAVVLPTR